jgi:16S rRNA (guanine(966)-N(2))-methyltransferase RsmD
MQAAINIVQFDLPGRVFVDLFAGTGRVGFEAARRGAGRVFLVDDNRDSFEILKCNHERFKFSNIELCFCSASEFIFSFGGKIDIVFLDPPFAVELDDLFLGNLYKKMNENGIIIYERPKTRAVPKSIGVLGLRKKYIYGKISLNLYMREQI